MKFKFRLEALKKYRKNRLLGARRELSKQEGVVQELQKRRDHANTERRFALQESGSFQGQAGWALFASRLVQTQSDKMRLIDKEIADAEVELERHRSWVQQLGRELRIVEKLEEKQREAFEKEIRVKEMRRMDNWVAERWPHRAKLLEDDAGEGANAS